MIRSLVLIAGTAFGLCIQAWAQQPDLMRDCLGSGAAADLRIAACSSIIDAGKEPNQNLALAFGHRAVARAQSKDLEGSRKDYEQSLRLDSKSAASHRFRGNVYLQDGDERKASEEFRKAIELDPKMGQAYANLGIMAARRGAATSALEYLDKAIELDPDNPLAYFFRGTARVQLESYGAAIEDFNIALRGPEPAAALFGRGSALAHMGEHEKALADYNEGMRQGTPGGETFAIRCAIRAVLGESFDAVMEDCDKAMSSPAAGSPQVRLMRGFALLKLDKPERAQTEFDLAMKMFAHFKQTPGQMEALYGRGLARLRLGNTAEGTKDIETAINNRPSAERRANSFLKINR